MGNKKMSILRFLATARVPIDRWRESVAGNLVGTRISTAKFKEAEEFCAKNRHHLLLFPLHLDGVPIPNLRVIFFSFDFDQPTKLKKNVLRMIKRKNMSKSTIDVAGPSRSRIRNWDVKQDAILLQILKE